MLNLSYLGKIGPDVENRVSAAALAVRILGARV